jgi:hypothetical protein
MISPSSPSWPKFLRFFVDCTRHAARITGSHEEHHRHVPEPLPTAHGQHAHRRALQLSLRVLLCSFREIEDVPPIAGSAAHPRRIKEARRHSHYVCWRRADAPPRSRIHASHLCGARAGDEPRDQWQSPRSQYVSTTVSLVALVGPLVRLTCARDQRSARAQAPA